VIGAGAADMLGPAMVVLLAGGVSVIMTNTQTLDTILHAMESLVSGTSAGVFTVITIGINIPLALLISVTASIMAHGLTLMWAPTSVVLVGGLAIAKVSYDKWLRFVWPLLAGLLVVATGVCAIAAA
jgi:uncharacterized ion transporter superfamily protein YfcC